MSLIRGNIWKKYEWLKKMKCWKIDTKEKKEKVGVMGCPWLDDVVHVFNRKLFSMALSYDKR